MSDRLAELRSALRLPPEDWDATIAPLVAGSGLACVPADQPGVPVHVGGQVVGRLTTQRPLDPGVLAGIAALLEALGAARHTIHDMAQAVAVAWREKNFLDECTRRLACELDLEAVAALAVEQLARSRSVDAATLWRVGPAGLTRWHAAGSWLEISDQELAAAQAEIMRGMPAVLDSDRGCRIVLRLAAESETLALLVLAGAPALAHAASLKFLVAVAAQIAQAIRLRLAIRRELEAIELRSQLDFAAEIQRGLLPAESPACPGLQLAGQSQPADLVGGDGYAFLPHAAGLDLMVADVSGHCVASGLLMASLLGMLRAQNADELSLSAIAERINRHVAREAGLSGQYVTALYARVASDLRSLELVSIGHPAPYLLRGGIARPLTLPCNLPAGIDEETSYRIQRFGLLPGDRVVFCTDGILEARAPDGAFFGTRVCSALERIGGLNAKALIEALFAACRAFADNVPPADDQTIVALVVEEGAHAL